MPHDGSRGLVLQNIAVGKLERPQFDVDSGKVLVGGNGCMSTPCLSPEVFRPIINNLVVVWIMKGRDLITFSIRQEVFVVTWSGTNDFSHRSGRGVLQLNNEPVLNAKRREGVIIGVDFENATRKMPSDRGTVPAIFRIPPSDHRTIRFQRRKGFSGSD